MKLRNVLFTIGITLFSFSVLLSPISALSGDAMRATPFDETVMENSGDEANLFLYNVFLTGNHSANSADTEGAIAIKGSSYVPARRSAWEPAHFNYGAYFDDFGSGAGEPLTSRHKIALLIGEGIITHSVGTAIVANGMVLTRESTLSWVNSDSIHFNGSIRTLNDTQMDALFDQLQDTLSQLCNHFDQFVDNLIPYKNGTIIIPETQDGLYGAHSKSHIVQLSSVDSGVLVVFVSAVDDTAFIPQLGLDEILNDDIKQIIITTDAKKVVMVGHATYQGLVYDFSTTIPGTNTKIAPLLSDKTTFYFPNATQITNFYAMQNAKPVAPDITISGTVAVNKPIDDAGNDAYNMSYFSSLVSHAHTAIFGSIVAPNATIILDSGNVNGYVFANNLHQREGAEAHNYYNPFYLTLFEEPEVDPIITTPEPNPDPLPEILTIDDPIATFYTAPNTGISSEIPLHLFLFLSILGVGALAKRKK